VFSVYFTMCMPHRAGVTGCVSVYSTLCDHSVCISICFAVCSTLWDYSVCISNLCHSVLCCSLCNSVFNVTRQTVVGNLTPHDWILFGRSGVQSNPCQKSELRLRGVRIEGELRQGLSRSSFIIRIRTRIQSGDQVCISTTII
jgi:hypothetical protein